MNAAEKFLLSVIVALAIFGWLVGIGLMTNNPVHSFYIQPCASQYCVYSYNNFKDAKVLGPVSFDKATEVVNEYNKIFWENKRSE